MPASGLQGGGQAGEPYPACLASALWDLTSEKTDVHTKAFPAPTHSCTQAEAEAKGTCWVVLPKFHTLPRSQPKLPSTHRLVTSPSSPTLQRISGEDATTMQPRAWRYTM